MHKWQRFIQVGMALVLTVAAACAGDSSDETSDTTLPEATDAPDASEPVDATAATSDTVAEGLDACSLLTTVQLEDATGRTFTVADQESPRVQTCYFDDGDGINLDFVSILHVGGDAGELFDGEVASYADSGTGTGESASDLPGIGERATTFDGAYTFVLAGQYVIGIGLDFNFDAPVGDRIETARTVAEMVAANVP